MTDPTIDRWLEQAERMQRLGDHAAAISSLKQALTHDPEQPAAHALLAISLLSTRRLHAAAREAAEALHLAPELPLALYAYATVAMAQQRWPAAEAAVTTLLALEPNDVANLRLAAEFHRREDPTRARKHLERARELDPDDPHTLVDLGQLALQQNRLDEAATLAEAALGHAPELSEAHVVAGHVALARGDVPRAREHARTALTNDPQDHEALGLLTAIKARENPLLGLWWRYQVFIGEPGSPRALGLLLGMFIAVRLVAIFADAWGAP
ncbi:MAG TPA: tetratricopeptide repeat protein, partial [Nannocystis sp.]